MALYVDQIATKFPHTSFPVINGEPDYQIIHDTWTLLYRNASIITTTLGGVNNGHIRLIMQDTLYTTIFHTPYNTPVEPGGTATVLLHETTAQHSQLWYEHSEVRHIHANYHNMDADLKKFLEAVNNTYISVLHNVFTVYMGSLTREIMNNMMDWYRRITAVEIKMKKKNQETLDMSHTINVLFKFIDEWVQHASEANTPFMSEKYLQMAYHAVRSSGMYTYDWKYFCRKQSV